MYVDMYTQIFTQTHVKVLTIAMAELSHVSELQIFRITVTSNDLID